METLHSFPAGNMGEEKGLLVLYLHPKEHSLLSARQNNCCSAQPAEVCPPCPTPPHTTHTTPTQPTQPTEPHTTHGPLSRLVVRIRPRRGDHPGAALQKLLCKSVPARKKVSRKNRTVRKCCEFRMWDFSFSTHLQNSIGVFMLLCASFKFPLSF